MKKVKAVWLGKSKKGFSSLDDLMQHNEFVGFRALGERYMITSVCGKYYAVRPPSFFHTNQDTALGKYFIFDSDRELFEWMLKDI